VFYSAVQHRLYICATPQYDRQGAVMSWTGHWFTMGTGQSFKTKEVEVHFAAKTDPIESHKPKSTQ